ncbi:MAG TPA: PKD domain-containing protein [Solirubrobacteraceae bacterium]|nr:PKD domain-containing protein [Solirubrobacteraceae bacterium]
MESKRLTGIAVLCGPMTVKRCRSFIGALSVVGAVVLAAALAPSTASALSLAEGLSGEPGAESGVRAACGPVMPGSSRCFALIDLGSRAGGNAAKRSAAAPLARSGGLEIEGPAGGLTPDDLATAYGYSLGSGGAGQTVGIVDAFDDPQIESNLGEFDSHYGLASCTAANGCLKKVGQTGGGVPSADTKGWSVEESLDVETVHAACPQCKILLVESNTEENSEMAAAVNEAVALGATVVSNSFGAPEVAFGASERSAFDHPGVPIVASTGDSGWDNWNLLFPEVRMPNDPASLPTVVAVGGTNLQLNADGTRFQEKVWNNNNPETDTPEQREEGLYVKGATGGGCSNRSSAQPWQRDIAGFAATGCGTGRPGADVSAVGAPKTGLDIYDTYNCGEKCAGADEGWVRIGGTSLSAPFIASLYALAGGGHGLPYPALTLYGRAADAASRFDVTKGGNGFCNDEPPSDCGSPNSFGLGRLDCEGEAQCDAVPGFDGPSGVGAPVGLGLFQPQAPTVVLSTPGSLVAGSPAGFNAGSSESAYPGGTIASASWLWGDGTTSTTGTSTSHAYASPGTYTVTLSVADSYGLTSAPVTKSVTVGSPSDGGGGGGPTESGGSGGGGGATEGGGGGGNSSGSGSGSSGSGSSGSGSISGSTPSSGSGGTAGFLIALPTAHLSSNSAKATKTGVVALQIVCASGGAACTGTVTLRGSVGEGHSAKNMALVLGSAPFSAAPGRTVTVTVHLSAKARAALARAHSLRTTVAILLRSASGTAHTATASLTIRAPKGGHSH